MTKPFDDLDILEQHPAVDVGEHEVLMSFGRDVDAMHFRHWWQVKGSVAFARWLAMPEETP